MDRLDLTDLRNYLTSLDCFLTIGQIRACVVNYLDHYGYKIKVCLDVYTTDSDNNYHNVYYLFSDFGTVDDVYFEGDYLTIGIEAM